MFSIDWLDRAADISADVWERCFPENVEGRWWYEALESSGLEDQFTFLYMVIKRDGEAVGVAPAFLMNVPMDVVAPPMIARALIAAGGVFPKLRYQRTLFIGSPCADEGTVGLAPGLALVDVAATIQAAVGARAKRERAAMIVWKDFPTSARPALDALCRSHGLFRSASFPGTVAPLPGPDFAAYLKSLNSNQRYNFKKKLKRNRAMGDLVAAVVQRPDEGALAEIFALFWQTYEKGKTKFERLNVAFFRNIATAPNAFFITLRHADSGKLAAFMLCFRVGDRAINKFIGIDYALAGDWFLYFRLWEEAVIWATGAGAVELQSGQTVYRAKRDLGHRLAPLYNYCKHRNVLLHPIFAAVGKRITWPGLDDGLSLADQREAEAAGA